MTDAAPSLEKAIRSQFAPVLRYDGFSGSGRHYWRLVGDQCHVVSIQGSRYGGQFAVNLAIQPVSVPLRSGADLEPKRLRVEQCAFRSRLAEDKSDQWWVYEPNQASMDDAVRHACRVYEQIGRRQFNAMSGSDSPINTMTAEAFVGGAFYLYGFHSLDSLPLIFAQMRAVAGNSAEARAFAKIGLEKLGAQTTASNLQVRLLELLALD